MHEKRIIPLVLLLISVGWIHDVAAQESQPLPPPVDIEFTSEGVSGMAEGELLIKVTVTPQEDMHADIRCLLPEGVEPQDAQGMMVSPSDESRFLDIPSDILYHQVIGLHVGPLKAGISKEFSFRIKITDHEQHELIVIVEALAKWGMKTQRLTVAK